MEIEKSTYEHLLACEARLGHLLQSNFIASFDEVDLCKHKYKRDIAEADNVAKAGESIMRLQKAAEETRDKLAEAFITAGENLNKSLNAYRGKSTLFGAAIEAPEEETMCIYYRDCFGSCDWCKTHDYSEACVPMLQQKLKREAEESKKINDALLYAFARLVEKRRTENEDS